MTTDEFIDLLNEDLSTEYQSIVQYNLHIATITGAEYVSTVDELTKHLAQELSHAQVLATQVAFLKGTPTTTVQVGHGRRWVPRRSAGRPPARRRAARALPGALCPSQRSRAGRRG